MEAFLIKILKVIRFILMQLKLWIVHRQFNNRATLLGNSHDLDLNSSVRLRFGSTKMDIILHDHSGTRGSLISHGGGKIVIGEWSMLGMRSRVESVNYVEIGRDCGISWDVVISDNNNHPINPDDRRYMRHTPHGSEERSMHHSDSAPIHIGDNVWIGSNVRVCKGVTIGDNSIIAANTVVTHDVPANSIAAGNPARIVKTDIDKNTTRRFPLKKMFT